MNPKLLLRIASILILLHALGHTYGFSGWKKTTDPVKQEVIGQMFGHSFEFKGTVRSLGEYYDGYGWFAAIALLAIALLLWIASSSTEQSRDVTKKIALVLSMSLLAIGIDELIFFFVFAASISLLAALLTGISAALLAKKQLR